MNLKEFLVTLMLALLGTWAIQYFFFNKKTTPEGVRTVQPFVAPTGAQAEKPLNTEINFIDTKNICSAYCHRGSN